MTRVADAPQPEPSAGPWPGGSYALRPVVVIPDIDQLHGPTRGHYSLPLHLNASAPRTFDLSTAADRLAAYQLVLLEAASTHDLIAWLDRDALIALWQDLYLPRIVRAAWEAIHPELAARGCAPHVPQL